MGDRDGGEGFGFAPRGSQARRDGVGTSRTPLLDRQYSSKPHPTRASIAQDYNHDKSEKPVWLWLGIGVLLGVGATLLTSSLWLPSGGDVDIVELEAPNQVTTSPGVAAANEAILSAPSAGAEPSAHPPEVDITATTSGASAELPLDAEAESLSPLSDGEKREAEARLVALDVEDAALHTSVNDNGQNGAASQMGLGKVDVGEDQEVNGLVAPAPSTTATTTERLLPADDAEDFALDEIKDVQASSGLSDPAEALAALTATPADSETDRADANEPTAEELDDRSSSAARTESKLTTPAVDAGLDDSVERTELAAVTPALASNPSPPSSTDSEPGGRLYRVQLAAVANEAAAQVYWREVNERLPGVFSGVEPVFDERVVEQRLYLRVWVGSFGLRREADSYCSWLKDRGQDCFVTRVDNL